MSLIQQELEAPAPDRQFGSGWISGVLALTFSIAGLGAVLCLRYPELLTVADARALYNVTFIRLVLHCVLIAGFVFGIVSIVLRRQKILGLTALGIILVATVLGGSHAQSRGIASDAYLGLDWFLLNLTFTGILFIPLERLLGVKEQGLFRFEWREDLFYFLVSTLLVQVLAYLTLLPALTILGHANLTGVRAWIASQPVVLQLIEIMFLTDLVQYWVHRTFHRVPFLWKFHALHHSAKVLDWLAGSRMHLFEIVCLRSLTVIPMYVLGFSEVALYSYLIFVFFFATLVHANIRSNFGPLERWFVTPRFHHWHHGIEKEAIDVNFAVHFPCLDWIFGTYHLPADGKWPTGYGIKNEIPKGFFRQFLYPFVREQPTPHPLGGEAANSGGASEAGTATDGDRSAGFP